LGMKILLEKGAQADIVDTSGMTPLHASAHGGYAICIQLLIQFGANIMLLDKKGLSALSYAAYSGSLGSIMLLLQEHHKNKGGMDSPSGINHADNSGMTPLLYAVKWNRIEAAEYLISQKASLKSVNKKSQNAMHLALEYLVTAKDPESKNSAFNMIAMLEVADDGSFDLEGLLSDQINEPEELTQSSTRVLTKRVTTRNIVGIKRKENEQRLYNFSDLQVFWKRKSGRKATNKKLLKKVETHKGRFSNAARKPNASARKNQPVSQI